MKISSYAKILHLGYKACEDLYRANRVWIEEKVDGSQFSAQLGHDGILRFRSKRAEVFTESAGMFAATCAHFESVRDNMQPGWVYRGEAFRGPKHNVIEYARAPKGHFVLWDVETAPGTFVSPGFRELCADEIGVEPVKVLDWWRTDGEECPHLTKEVAERILDTESQLGGHKIEGFVVKQHEVFDRLGKLVLAKFVSEKFKEKHSRAGNPGGDTKKADVLEELTQELATEARWAKARQRLSEEGSLTRTPKDIGKLIAYAQQDIVEEEHRYIAERLYSALSKQIIRGSTRGLAEWYKNSLMSEV